MPRSGTTFVAELLASDWQTQYVHEPFNPQVGIKGYDWSLPINFDDDCFPVDQWVIEAVDKLNILDFRLGKHSVAADPLLRRLVKNIMGGRGPVSLLAAKINRFAKRRVIKCPIGWYFLPYLNFRCGMVPVVVVKHPVSIAASFMRAGWQANPMLWANLHGMEHLYSNDELNQIQSPPSCPYELVGWQWRLTYKPLSHWMKSHSDGVIVSIEELSESPVTTFQSVFEHLGLSFSAKLEKRILKFTGGRSAEARANRFQDLKRRSKDIFSLRVNSVPAEARSVIYAITSELAANWYSRESYSL